MVSGDEIEAYFFKKNTIKIFKQSYKNDHFDK